MVEQGATLADMRARAAIQERVMELGLRKVAEASGVNHSQLSMWLNGKCEMSWSKVMGVLDVAGLEIKVTRPRGRQKQSV